MTTLARKLQARNHEVVFISLPEREYNQINSILSRG
jgi:UDP:flavonoid glycosyltransferase YjiC (YdhE family)